MLLYIRSVLIAVLLILHGSAHALCADGKPTFEKEWNRSRYVLVGRLVASKPVIAADDPQGVEATDYTVAVVRSFKGNAGRVISIRSDNTSSRFIMRPGYSYILFIESDASTNFVDPCGSSGELSQRSPYR